MTAQHYHDRVVTIGWVVVTSSLVWAGAYFIVFAALMTLLFNLRTAISDMSILYFAPIMVLLFMSGLASLLCMWHAIFVHFFPGIFLHGLRGSGRAMPVFSVLQSVRERNASKPQDKAHAMRGILRNLGAALSPVNHEHSLGRIYRDFFTDLVAWQPAMVNLLVDAGGPPLADAPVVGARLVHRQGPRLAAVREAVRLRQQTQRRRRILLADSRHFGGRDDGPKHRHRRHHRLVRAIRGLHLRLWRRAGAIRPAPCGPRCRHFPNGWPS